MASMDNLPQELLYKILLELPVHDIVQSCESNSKLKLMCNNQYFWRLKAEKDYLEYLYLFTTFIDHNKWKELLIYLNSVRTIPIYYQDKIIAHVKIFPLDTVVQLYYLLRDISIETFKTRSLPTVSNGLPFIYLKDVYTYTSVLSGSLLAVFSTDEYQAIVNAINVVNRYQTIGNVPTRERTTDLVLRTRYPFPDSQFENNLLDNNKQFYPVQGTEPIHFIVDNRPLCEVTINELFASRAFGVLSNHVDLKYNLFNSLEKLYLSY